MLKQFAAVPFGTLQCIKRQADCILKGVFFMKKTTASGTSRRFPLIWKILIPILALILIVVSVIAVYSAQNVKAMDKAVDAALSTISQEYTLTPEDPANYEEIKVYNIFDFHVQQYSVEGVGNLSVMKVNMGFMQMATLILTPIEKNLPLVSADYMYQFGKRTSYLEFYDCVPDLEDEAYQSLLSDLSAVKEKYTGLEDTTPTPAWYDSLKTVGFYKLGKAKDDPTLDQMLCDGFKTVLDSAKELPTLTEEEMSAKRQLCKDYSDGLISNGGISTDVFKEQLGEDTTRDFFDQVLFGTEHYGK